jgi:fructokinase
MRQSDDQAVKKANTLLCFGEILWDVFPDYKKAGGAPFNVAANLVDLGNKVQLISSVGDDPNGMELLLEVERRGIEKDFIQINEEHPSGEVLISLDKAGIPTYHIKENSAWDNIDLSDQMLQSVKEADAFIYGSLAARSPRSRHSLFELIQHAKLAICDLNIRQSYYSEKLINTLLKETVILKINEEEAHILQKMFSLNESDLFPKLISLFDLEMIIKTLGRNGAEVYYKNELYSHPGFFVKVKDTVGSGDAFLASFIHEFLGGSSIDLCLKNANQLGAFVAAQRGALPR